MQGDSRLLSWLHRGRRQLLVERKMETLEGCGVRVVRQGVWKISLILRQTWIKERNIK